MQWNDNLKGESDKFYHKITSKQIMSSICKKVYKDGEEKEDRREKMKRVEDAQSEEEKEDRQSEEANRKTNQKFETFL